MSMIAAFSCDGDSDVIDDDIDGTFLAGVIFAPVFCQNGIFAGLLLKPINKII